MRPLGWPLLLAAATFSSGCLFLAPRPEFRPGAVRERTVILSVEGTPGLAFEGAYGTPQQSTSVRGIVPAEFVVRTHVAVVATFTKAAADGELIVRVLEDGREVQRRSTSAPFGTIVVNRTYAP
ncbi:MAG: hypothetical protein QN168_14070 [Armatimonadota bacterium]|nr:hypothetical protein [Armatimonadota bacterium]